LSLAQTAAPMLDRSWAAQEGKSVVARRLVIAIAGNPALGRLEVRNTGPGIVRVGGAALAARAAEAAAHSKGRDASGLLVPVQWSNLDTVLA
jgi:hypothetical protein